MVKKDQNNHNHSHPMILHCGKTSSLHGIIVFALCVQLLPHAFAQPNNDNSGGPNGYPYTNPNFKPSMTVTIVILVVACVFIAFISFYIRRCSHDMHMTGGSVRITRTRPAPRGLDASVIETFPTFLYSVVKGLKIGKGVLECAVCLNEFEDDETLRLLPKCDHVFHPECIDAWLSSHTTCPVCRAELAAHQPSELPQVVPEFDAQSVENGETSEPQSDVSIHVSDEDQSKPDVINPTDQTAFPIQNHPARSKSMLRGIAGRFPRSHSTGHSHVHPGENHERFTLKLPDDIRKKILNGKLNRTTSCITVPTQGSGCRNGSTRGRISQSGPLEPAAKSDRWGFLTATPFFWRNSSARLSKKGGGSISAKSDGMGASSSTRPPV